MQFSLLSWPIFPSFAFDWITNNTQHVLSGFLVWGFCVWLFFMQNEIVMKSWIKDNYAKLTVQAGWFSSLLHIMFEKDASKSNSSERTVLLQVACISWTLGKHFVLLWHNQGIFSAFPDRMKRKYVQKSCNAKDCLDPTFCPCGFFFCKPVIKVEQKLACQVF